MSFNQNSTFGFGTSNGGSGPGGVTSVFGRTGDVVAQSGDYDTSLVPESGNLYFTGPRVLSTTLTGYASSPGVISAADSVLSAIQKLNGNISALVTGVSSFNTRTGAIVLSSADVTGALGFTPYNATNPAGYISTISGIIAGGEITGTYPSPTLVNDAVIAKTLTNYLSGAGVITPSDSILTAIQKLDGNTAALVTGVSSVFGRAGAVTAQSGDYTSTQVTEGTNLYFTNARAIAAVLTGYSSGAGTISATDSILSAIQKLNGNIGLLTGAVIYQGTWNASTNTPTLTSGVGTKGFMYKVSVAGTTTLDGISQWNVGDSVVFDGTVWDKLDGIATEVISVFGRVGAVVATSGDYNTSLVTENTNLYFTNARAIAATLTGYSSGAGTISATDSVLSAIQKLNGNTAALVTGVSSVNGASGTVTITVTGTTNRIAVSGGTGTTPTIDISASYVGQSSITTLGTITTGVWNGTAITNGNLANSSVTVNGTSISLGSSGTVTAAAGTLTGATLASGVTASSLTSFGASIALGTPASGNLANCTFPTLNQNTSGTAANITASSNTSLTSLSNLVTVGALTSGSIGTGFVVKGVTMTLGSDGTGDIYYRNASGVLTRIGIGSTNQILAVSVGGLPNWVTSSGGTLYSADGTTLSLSGGNVFSINLANANTWTGVQTFGAGKAVLAAGTTGLAPLTWTVGSAALLTSVVQATEEVDSSGLKYYTTETTAGRGTVPAIQRFRLTSNGSTISTISNFFGTSSNITLVANAEYEIEIECYFTNTTAGTVTWTFTNSAAPTLQNIYYKASPVGGIVAPAGSASAGYLEGNIQGNSTAAEALTTTGTLTTATTQYAYFKIYLINGTGTSLKIQATKLVGGTITPLAGSYWKCTRVPAANVGIFAA